MQDRLQKIIARSGLMSRRAAEDVILAGRVRVNGKVTIELGTKADPRVDKVEVDGKPILAEDLYYVVLHKPRGVVSTVSDPEKRPTVAELVKRMPVRLYPVGRLDFATSGVLLMTNDGEFANALLHPSGGVPKTYVLKVVGIMDDTALDTWRQGVELEDGKTLPTKARLIRYEDGKTWFEITLREGRNQQIRRMGDATGFRVMRLARTSFAGITSDDLRPGDYRALTRDELMALKKEFGVPRRIRTAQVPAESKPTRAFRAPKARADEGARAPARGGERTSEARPKNPRARPAPAKEAPRGARSGRSGPSETTPRAAASRDPRARGRDRH